MKNGYYISAYLSINPLANLYDISLRHDQSVALWYLEDNNVRLVRYWELERKTGLKKHSKSFFSAEQCYHFLISLLNEVGVSLEDINEIWGTPGIENNGLVTHYSVDNSCPYHALAHLYSGLLVDTDSFFGGKILAFALDGGPDNVVDHFARNKKFYWGCYCDYGKTTFFPVCSPGAYWSLLRLKFDMEEGSLMALGSASTAHIHNMEEYVSIAPLVEDGEDFTYAYKWIEKISSDVYEIEKSEIIDYDANFSEDENRLSVLVKIVQNASKQVIKRIVDDAVSRFNINPSDTVLAMTGGFALNCPTNSYIMNSYRFKKFETCPCVSDSGIALGIGLYEFSSELNHFNFKLGNAYHGSTNNSLIDDIEIWNTYIESITEFSPEQFVDDIINGLIIWFDGPAEIGPRALGARSILGNPLSDRTKEELNKVKRRQWWRPVAPIIIEGQEEVWFDNSFNSPYMLCTCFMKEEYRSSVPAILHIDGSARIQSLPKDDDSRLAQGLYAFFLKTGIPMICNTSLNDKGEPIIDTLNQGMNFALRKGINIFYYNGYRISIKNHSDYKVRFPYHRDRKLVYLSEEKSNKEKELLNPENLSEKELDIYLNMQELRDYDITNKNDVYKLRRILKRWKHLNNSVWSATLL